jgi:membrane-associated phospholipid phosphatase
MMNMKWIQKTTLAAMTLLAGTTSHAQDTAAYIMETTTQHQARIQQEEVYRRTKADIPFTLGAAAFTIFGFTQAYSKDDTPEATIRNLNINNIPKFDRWAVDEYSESAAKTSDLIFYGSIPLPVLLMLDKKIRRDAGRILMLYTQAMSVTGSLYTGATMVTNRYRPYAYNSNASMGDRVEGNARNSFFGGHAALVGTATFFTAKVYSDYHPESRVKWLLYGGAGFATAATAYLRHRGGRHFPSDLVVGTAVGVLSGMLIPSIHKVKPFKNADMTVIPFTGMSHGLAFTYRIE